MPRTRPLSPAARRARSRRLWQHATAALVVGTCGALGALGALLALSGDPRLAALPIAGVGLVLLLAMAVQD